MTVVNYANRTFELSEKLSIYKVSEIKRLLLAAYSMEMDKSGTFYLDLSKADSVDSAVFQILISLKKSIEAGKGKLELKKSNVVFDTLLTTLGVTKDIFSKAA